MQGERGLERKREWEGEREAMKSRWWGEREREERGVVQLSPVLRSVSVPPQNLKAESGIKRLRQRGGEARGPREETVRRRDKQRRRKDEREGWREGEGKGERKK